MSMFFSQIPCHGKCTSTSQLLLPPGEPWIFGSLLAEPSGQLETDKGCRTISQHPLPQQMVVGSWLRRRGWRGWVARCGLWQQRCERKSSLVHLPALPWMGGAAQSCQMCSLGSFPGTESGKRAINPMPRPALAEWEVVQCILVLWGSPARV